MLDTLKAHVAGLARCVEEIDPRLLPGDEPLVLLDVAAEIERLGTALKLLVAGGAVTRSRWRDGGHRSAAAWLADATRSSISDAISTLDTARRLEDLPATTEALRRGELSGAQVHAVAAAASAHPPSEAELIEAAGMLSVKGLRQHARFVEAAAMPDTPEARAEMHRRRYLRFWSEADGMLRMSGAFTAEDGAQVMDAVRSRSVHVADETYRAGVPDEPQAAYDADALVALATGDDRIATFDGLRGGRSRSASVILHVSLEGLRRGSLEPGEQCHIPGVGPVPLVAAQNLMGDAFASLVVSDGVDVTTVCHIGRTVPSHVRSALEARDPVCVVPDCHVALSLEIDHWQVPFAEGGASELWNLARICRTHHRLKTYEGFELRGGPGKWEWVPPIRA